MKPPLLISFLLIVGLPSCGGTHIPANRPESRVIEILPDQAPTAAETRSQSDRFALHGWDDDSTLVLSKAEYLAMHYNPRLTAMSYDIRSAEARTLQASLYPRPELIVEMENFGGQDAFRGLNNSETTFGLAQQILLSGQRSRATEVAALESDLVAWEYERIRLDIIMEVRKAFTDVLLEQSKLDLREKQVQLSLQILETVSNRVRAGLVSPAEEARARVALEESKVQVVKSRMRLTTSRNQLAMLWGEPSAVFISAIGELPLPQDYLDEQKLQSRLSDNPDVRRFETALKHREAIVELENARGRIDPVISGGFRHYAASGENAFVAGLSVPLNFFSRNQGAQEAAVIELDKTKQVLQATKLSLRTEFDGVYRNLMSLQSEITAMRDIILPQAQSAYETIADGYVQGRFAFLDLLSAQQALYEARIRYLDVRAESRKTTAVLERLVASQVITSN